MATKLYLGKIPICVRSLNEGFLGRVEPVRGGAEERDYDLDPVEMRDAPEFETLSDADAIAAQQEQERNESSLFHMYMREEPAKRWLLDQNGDGYCWGYSTGDAFMFDRLKQNLTDASLPFVVINPHATCAIIKRDRKSVV